MVLANKLNIANQLELKKAEEKISKQKAKKLFESGEINRVEVGTFKGLSQIHQFLFSEIHEFSGRLRDVNIAKGNFRFASKRSVVKDLKIKQLLQSVLTDKINDRELFMKGIDISYCYEGCSEFRIEDL